MSPSRAPRWLHGFAQGHTKSKDWRSVSCPFHTTWSRKNNGNVKRFPTRSLQYGLQLPRLLGAARENVTVEENIAEQRRTRGKTISLIRRLTDARGALGHLRTLSPADASAAAGVCLVQTPPCSLPLSFHFHPVCSKSVSWQELGGTSHNGPTGKMLCAHMETWLSGGWICHIKGFKVKVSPLSPKATLWLLMMILSWQGSGGQSI